MRVRIHRGAHEIGGNCVEVEHDGQRIVLDIGRPLGLDWSEPAELPQVPGLSRPDESTLGVLITHYHPDHWGLADQAHLDLPLFMGAATQRILASAAFWTRGLDVPVAGHLAHREELEIGPFRITPFLNDHSAFDAYSLLVEAGGRRLFYTGDIRGHGRKSGIFEELLRKAPPDVDVLLAEGTNLHAAGRAKPTVSESDLEVRMAAELERAGGLALVVTSAQNLDRLVTIYRACLRADRTLVMDAYTADVARATGNPNIPRPAAEWPKVRAYLPRWQAIRIKRAEAFQRLDDVNPFRIFPEHIAANPGRYVLLFSVGEGHRLATAGALGGAVCIWSLWDGYLDEPSGQRLLAFLDAHGIPMARHHTSGHASAEDLRRLAAALAPGRVVPIHTDHPDGFEGLVERLDIQPDLAWWEV